MASTTVHENKKIAVINPAGHAEDIGRKLRNSTERAETFKLAQYLQEKLEGGNDELRVILTRTPGETIVDFQNASFANRLGNIDLFISLHCYLEDSPKPKIFIYHYISDPVADFATRTIPNLSFVSVLHAHQANAARSRSFASRLKNSFNSYECSNVFDFSGLYGIPVKPLLGIKAPAILLEIGIPQNNSEVPKDLADLICSKIGDFF